MNHLSFSKKMNSYTLLYIEDDNEVRQYISSFLKRYFKEVYQSASAEEGLKLYKKHQPDILLLDINLGGMSGVELATLIRKKDQKTRIVISTAYTNPEFLIQAVELGLTRYLVKPLTNEDLVKAFEKCSDELQLSKKNQNKDIILSKGCIYHQEKAQILIDNEKEITLRHKEVEVLEFFLAHENEVVRYEQLEDGIWLNEPMTRDAIRSQIRNLRKKLKVDLFQNISGLGYSFKRESL